MRKACTVVLLERISKRVCLTRNVLLFDSCREEPDDHGMIVRVDEFGEIDMETYMYPLYEQNEFSLSFLNSVKMFA
jgi:arginine utilization protein RocB